MIAHVISNGPSAGQYEPRLAVRDDAIVVAVNGMALVYPADWICAHDGQVFGHTPDEIRRGGVPPALDYPRLFTDSGKPQWLGKSETKRFFIHWHALEWLRDNRDDIWRVLAGHYVCWWPAAAPDLPYTGLAPLVLLPMLGCQDATLWGYDMAGKAGTLPGANDTRTAERWAQERALFFRLAAIGELRLTDGVTGERLAE